MKLYFILDTAEFERQENRRLLEIVPGINPNTTWQEWENNFIGNIKYAIQVDHGLRTKWSLDSVLDFYKTNLHMLASLAHQGKISQIIAPSIHTNPYKYPLRRNNLEKLVSLADEKGQNVIKTTFETAEKLVSGTRNYKSGVLQHTQFCTLLSNYQPKPLPFEPFLTKLFHPQKYQAIAGSRIYTSKFTFLKT